VNQPVKTKKIISWLFKSTMDATNLCVCGHISTEPGDSESATPDDSWLLQIECDICHIWYHARCVKLGRIGVLSIDKYHCPRCESLCGPSIMKPITNEHRHNPTEEDASDKPPQIGTLMFVEELVKRQLPSALDVGGVVDIVANGNELTLPYLSSSGFARPIVVPESTGLGITMPEREFCIQDVPSAVGPDKQIDVINVHSQDTMVMTVEDFCNSFETPHSERIASLNCLSLEVSELPLGDDVMPPLVARMLCWVTNVWPQSVQDRWEGGEPPQVQKYCIMSMEGSYTG
jgi:lysine-specific demethylase PHF8